MSAPLHGPGAPAGHSNSLPASFLPVTETFIIKRPRSNAEREARAGDSRCRSVRNWGCRYS